MYRVIDITKFLIKSRAKEIGIMFGALFGITLLMSPVIALLLFAVATKFMGMFISIAFIFTSSFSGLFNDYRNIMYKGVTRETLAKSYLLSLILTVIGLGILTVGMRMFPTSGMEIDFGNSLLGVDLKKISTIHSIVLHIMILLTWSGLANLFSIGIFKKMGNKIGMNILLILSVIVILMRVLSELKFGGEQLFAFTSTIGYSIPLTVLFYGVLSVGLYYMTYNILRKLEV